MNYKKNYFDYINYVKTLTREKGCNVYYEKHHIIPKCVGGTNKKDNLVLLTAREHFLAHYLLCKIYKNTKYEFNIAYAFVVMKRDPNGNRYINSKLYEFARKNLSEASSKKNKGRKAWNKGIPRSEAVKLAVSEANKGREAWNKGKKLPKNSEESNLKRSETLKNGYKQGTHKSRKGYIPWNKGKKIGVSNKTKEARQRKALPKIEKIKNSNVDFSKIGWAKKVASIVEMNPSCLVSFMKNNMSDFYEQNCWKRNKT